MRIAYLISVYKDPMHLHRLIKVLSWGMEKQVRFFVHVDAKVEIEPFEKCCKDISNIVFLTKRYWVQWGGIRRCFIKWNCLKRPCEMKQYLVGLTDL